MRAGSLRHRVRIQQLVIARTTTGSTGSDWADLCTVWAEVKGVSGRAFLAASAEQSEVTFDIRIRYRDDVMARMRVVHKAQTLEIVAPLPDESRQWLRLMCKTVKV